jgi:hypothetical protein
VVVVIVRERLWKPVPQEWEQEPHVDHVLTTQSMGQGSEEQSVVYLRSGQE